MPGDLLDTYAAALQHDLVELPPPTRRIGVVRRPTPWILAVVDENIPALGPPGTLLEEVKARQTTLREDGLGDADAHNQAMNDVGYDERYRRHLRESAEAIRAIGRIRERLANGEDIALICFENTDEKRCHRTLLKARILAE